MTREHKNTWKCVQCISGQPKSDNTNTPVCGSHDNVTMHRGARNSPEKRLARVAVDMDVSYNQQSPNDTALDDTIGMTDTQVLVAEIRRFREELREDMQALRLQMHDLTISLSDIVTRVNSCDERIVS